MRIASTESATRAGVPFAVLYGEESSIWNMRGMRADSGKTVEESGSMIFMRETLPSGTPFVAVPEAGHHLMVDQPLAVVAALRALLLHPSFGAPAKL